MEKKYIVTKTQLKRIVQKSNILYQLYDEDNKLVLDNIKSIKVAERLKTTLGNRLNEILTIKPKK